MKILVLVGLVSLFAFQFQGNAKKSMPRKSDRIGLQIFPENDTLSLQEPVILTANLTNLRKCKFRIWDGIDFGRPDGIFGEISLEILLDGRVYEDWKKRAFYIRYHTPTPADVQILEHGETYTTTLDIQDRYPLWERGTYKIRGIFRPLRIRGLKLSVIKPVYSEWVEVVVK